MAKKTKQQRKAIRKEGWKQAAQGLKEMYIDSSKNVLAEMGKGFTSGASKAFEKGNRTKLPAANFAGAGLAGLGGAAVAAVKSIPSTAKKVARGNWNFIKGVFKGIFNHPDWWAYRNVLSIPAHNKNRPFDTLAVKSINGTNNIAVGVGVTHIVKQNVEFTDILNTESFQLAAIEAFKEIRLDLKSNLPYTQDQYNQFIIMAMAVCAKAKAIERTLGWYNITRPDIPELQNAMQSVPASSAEVGKLTPTKIGCINGDSYASTLNAYRKLQSICSNIAIPRKLSEFISWWMASVFIDQSEPNAQLYVNELRSCPIYKIDTNNDLVISGSWDIATGSIQDVIDEALTLLNYYGIMNADIHKTGKYGTIQLSGVEKNEYTPITLCDPEFFTILINNYTISHTDSVLSTLMKPEYVRIDVLEELNDANLVGVTNALSTWAQVAVPFKIVSQCCYITSDASYRSPRNSNIVADITADAVGAEYTFATGDYWLQVNSYILNNADIKVLASSSSLLSLFTYDSKYAGSGLGTISAMTAAVKAGTTNLPAEIDSFSGYGGFTIGMCADGTFIDIVFQFTSGVLTSISLTNETTGNLNWHHYSSVGTVLHTFTSGTNYTLATTSVGPMKFNEVTFLTSVLTIASAARVKVLSLYTVGSTWYSGVSLLGDLTVTETTTTNTATFKSLNVQAIDNFCDLVDYHLPIVQRQNFTISNGSHKLTVYGLPVLKKGTYIPLIFNYSDVSAVLYWMYLGLFSLS